jgi:hypothetical protein
MTYDIYAHTVVRKRLIDPTGTRFEKGEMADRRWKGGYATEVEAKEEAARLSIRFGITFFVVEAKGDDDGSR